MILKQYYLGCLAHASYLVGDEEAGVAAVIDPQRDIDAYVEDAERLACSIDHVVLTHLHADFVAGHLELRDRTGAEIHLGARAQAEYAFTPAADGDSIELGRVRLEIIETPGHSPESVSIVVHDLAGGTARPHAVLTGDTLFIGDVGRPDLRESSGWSPEELGALLYDSLRSRLTALPDQTLVYPAHGAGSRCGKHLSNETVSTLGAQRRDNYALQPMSREAFIRLVTADQPEAPAYFGYDTVLNTKEHPTLDQALARVLTPLTLAEVLELRENGAQMLDARASGDFARAHLSASINIGLDGSYASWAGIILDHERPIVIVVEPGREREAALRLGRIGFDNVAGFLEGGMLALRERPELVTRCERLTAPMLIARLADEPSLCVLDARSKEETRAGQILGSVNIPLERLQNGLDRLPRGRSIVVYCSSGYRSSVAVSILRAVGFGDVADLVGGLDAAQRAGGIADALHLDLAPSH